MLLEEVQRGAEARDERETSEKSGKESGATQKRA
jgi:hypothetical protein